MSKKARNVVLRVVVNLCRMVLAATFLFSGFVKANDPLGTVYKLNDYFAAWSIYNIPELLTLAITFILFTLEFGIGVYLLLGIRRRIVSIITLVLMAGMTLFTVYIAIYNPVSDCGCFGDAIILTNTQTLLKNIVLLACAFVVFRWNGLIQPLISRQVSWIVSTLAILALIAYSGYCIYSQPLIDFRPYKQGTDLQHLIQVPAEQRPQFEVTLVYERDGEQMEIGIDDDDPDNSWTYVETRRRMLSGNSADVINDFYIETDDGEDIASDILEAEGYTLLLVAPVLETADQSIMDRINDLYDYAQQADITFVAVTASGQEARSKWIDYTGAEYQFFTSDERTLKTIVRANPGLVLIADGVVCRKWSNWNFPRTEQIEEFINSINQ